MASAAACVAHASSSTSAEKWERAIVLDTDESAVAFASIKAGGHLR
jgi:RNA polymerase subunit RPABC4/transcription elongation factor Spt4